MSKPYFARTDFRNQNDPFYCKLPDTFYHRLLVGKSGSGKTSTLKKLMQMNVEHIPPIGYLFIDPHGDAALEVFESLSLEQKKQTIYIDLANPELDFGLNLFRSVSPAKRSLVASNILECFQRNWKSSWGQKMEAILRESILLLLQQSNAHIGDLSRVLLDKAFRDQCLVNLKNPDSIRFWSLIFPKYKLNIDLLPILNKVSSLLSHDLMRKILIENKPLSLRQAMDSSQFIIVRAARGSVGTDTMNLFLSLFMVSMASAAFSRIDTPVVERKPFYWYLDEFAQFSGADLLAELVAQLRKFRVGLVLSVQSITTLDPIIRDGLLSNIGTIICFRLGISQAKIFEKLFYPEFEAIDFTGLGTGEIYLQMMIDGKPSKPFSAKTIL